MTLPAVTMPFGAPATTMVPIPANIALAGLRLHMQALVVTVAPTANVGLSSLVTATLLR